MCAPTVWRASVVIALVRDVLGRHSTTLRGVMRGKPTGKANWRDRLPMASQESGRATQRCPVALHRRRRQASSLRLFSHLKGTRAIESGALGLKPTGRLRGTRESQGHQAVAISRQGKKNSVTRYRSLDRSGGMGCWWGSQVTQNGGAHQYAFKQVTAVAKPPRQAPAHSSRRSTAVQGIPRGRKRCSVPGCAK